MLTPLSNKLVIERDAADKVTPGGIHLPDTAKEKPRRGKVVAAGPGKLLENGRCGAMTVKVGDCAVFGAYSGSEVEEGGKRYVVLSEDDVLAVVS